MYINQQSVSSSDQIPERGTRSDKKPVVPLYSEWRKKPSSASMSDHWEPKNMDLMQCKQSAKETHFSNLIDATSSVYVQELTNQS